MNFEAAVIYLLQYIAAIKYFVLHVYVSVDHENISQSSLHIQYAEDVMRCVLKTRAHF